MGTKLGVRWGWGSGRGGGLEGVGGDEQHSWGAGTSWSRLRSYGLSHPHEDSLAPSSEINLFLF